MQLKKNKKNATNIKTQQREIQLQLIRRKMPTRKPSISSWSVSGSVGESALPLEPVKAAAAVRRSVLPSGYKRSKNKRPKWTIFGSKRADYTVSLLFQGCSTATSTANKSRVALFFFLSFELLKKHHGELETLIKRSKSVNYHSPPALQFRQPLCL